MKGKAIALLLSVLSYCCVALAAPTDIETAADRVESAAGEHRLIVIGEMHGTREVPDLIEALARRYARQGPLRVALEVTRDEQSALNAYLAGPGGQGRREALSRRGYWNIDTATSDGRRNEDTLDLIEALRVLRADGLDVAVVAFDLTQQPDGAPRSESGKRRAAERDLAMAQYLREAYAALPRGRMLVMTGNVHAMLRAPNPRFQTPMTSHLQDLNPYTFNVAAGEGAFWACLSGQPCGPVPMKTSRASGALPADDTHHYLLVLPRFTPARLVGAEPR